MFANVVTAISSSAFVTLTLLYVMNLLIGIQPQAVVEPPSPWTIDWVRVPTPPEPPDIIEPPPGREFVEPPTPPMTYAPSGDAEAIGFRPPTTTPPPVSRYSVPGITLGDGPLVLLVRHSPVYPARALQEGIEGWVIVEFDVLADGTATNIAVVESSFQIFENSARHAAAKLRFKPLVIDGIPQVTPGVRYIFRFRMSD